MIVLAALVWQVTETFGQAEPVITTTEFMDRLKKNQFGKIEVTSSPSGGELRVLAQLAVFEFAKIGAQQCRVCARAQQRHDLFIVKIAEIRNGSGLRHADR